MDLVKGLFEGSRLALARSITAVENEYENAIDIMKAIYPKTGNARILGITGAPGAGKSTLTDKVVKHYLDQGKKIGIVAIDPTSPFSGGAILGDRIRMVLVIGGGVIPDADIPGLKEAGVAAVFTPGTPTGDIVDFIKENVK